MKAPGDCSPYMQHPCGKKKKEFGVTYKNLYLLQTSYLGLKSNSKSDIHVGKYFKEQQLHPCFFQLVAEEDYCSSGQIDKEIRQEDCESLTSPGSYLTYFSLVFSLGASYSAVIFIVNFF